MRKIAFVSSALQQPRHQKRIDLLRKNFAVQVFYFYRNKYVENIKGYINSAIKVGEVKDRKYFSRLLLLVRLYWLLRRSDAEILYCTSPDQALVAAFTGKRVILEVGDLYQVDGAGRIFRLLDQILIPRLSALVVTSPYYYSGYYSKFQKYLKGKVVVIENKLSPTLEADIRKYRDGFARPPFCRPKLGLIGSLSFERSLKKLRDFAAHSPDVELHIYGDGLHSIFEGLDNATYHGRFRNPEDLPGIYGQIDINVILYDIDNNNVKLALPNKLYESIAFLRPIVCSNDVALSDVVRSGGFGEVVCEDGIEGAVSRILSNYDEYVAKLAAQEPEAYLCFEQDAVVRLMRDL